jgi:hypothetical protein
MGVFSLSGLLREACCCLLILPLDYLCYVRSDSRPPFVLLVMHQIQPCLLYNPLQIRILLQSCPSSANGLSAAASQRNQAYPNRRGPTIGRWRYPPSSTWDARAVSSLTRYRTHQILYSRRPTSKGPRSRLPGGDDPVFHSVPAPLSPSPSVESRPARLPIG